MNSRFRFSCCVFSMALLVGSVIAGPVNADDNVLRWKLKQGQKFNVEVVQEMNQVINFAGNEQEIPINMKMWMTWNVVESDGNTFKLEQVFDRVTMTLDTPFMTIEFDSDDAEDLEGPEAQIGEALGALVGGKMTQTMDARGNVTDVEISDELKGDSGGGFGQMFSGDELKNLLGQAYSILPEGPVSKGQKWNQEVKTKMMQMEFNIDSHYQYEGVKTVDGKELHEISVTSKLNTKDDDGTIEGPMGGEMTITNQEQSGKIYFDNKAGYFVESSITQDMEMSVDAGGQEMEMTIEGKVKITVKPEK